jgi:hypothetical protein
MRDLIHFQKRRHQNENSAIIHHRVVSCCVARVLIRLSVVLVDFPSKDEPINSLLRCRVIQPDPQKLSVDFVLKSTVRQRPIITGKALGKFEKPAYILPELSRLLNHHFRVVLRDTSIHHGEPITSSSKPISSPIR